MAVRNAVVTVGTTPTLISLGNENSKSTIIIHSATAQMYIGGPDVTTSTGLHVGNGDTIQFDLYSGEDLYGIVATGTADTRIVQNGF